MLFFWCFAWAELAWSGGETPANLAWLALIYSGITLSGMAAYGPSIWLERAEFFTIFFGYMGRFAPLGLRRSAAPQTPQEDVTLLSGDAAGHVLVLRPFGGGLTPTSARSLSASAFIVLMLSTVTLDGLMETPLWAATQDAILSTEFLAPA